MKKIIFALLLIMHIPLGYANEKAQKPKLVDVTIQIIHTSNDSQTRLNNKISLQNNNRWINISALELQTSTSSSTSVQSQPTAPSIQSLSFVKIVSANSKTVALEFLIINKEHDHYAAHQPRLIINYNQKGAIEISDSHNKEHTTVSAIANIKA